MQFGVPAKSDRFAMNSNCGSRSEISNVRKFDKHLQFFILESIYPKQPQQHEDFFLGSSFSNNGLSSFGWELCASGLELAGCSAFFSSFAFAFCSFFSFFFCCFSSCFCFYKFVTNETLYNQPQPLCLLSQLLPFASSALPFLLLSASS